MNYENAKGGKYLPPFFACKFCYVYKNTKDMAQTLVVNLMAQVFSILKWRGIECEMVSEFAKELVWADRKKTFKDETYIFSKQNHKLFMVNGQVDVIVTDRPLFLTIPYSRKYGSPEMKSYYAALEKLVIETLRMYDNMNILLTRTKPYNPNGRNQTEEESAELAILFEDCMKEHKLHYDKIPATFEAAAEIVEKIEERLNWKR